MDLKLEAIRLATRILIKNIDCDLSKATCDGCHALTEDGKCILTIMCNQLLSLERKNGEQNNNG